MWLGNRHFSEKYLRHVRIEMLAGMNDDFVHPSIGGNGAADYSCLDELRMGTYDGDDFLH